MIAAGVGHMAHSAHDVMENLSYAMLITAAGGTLIYGLYADDIPARRDPLTGLEAAGLAVVPAFRCAQAIGNVAAIPV